MIIAQNVTKYFGGFQALKDISFEIAKGEIVGFLGRNAAGKTTIMRILTSYLPATSGKVIIGGEDVSRNSLAVRKKVGYLPEMPPLYSNMTVKEYLQFAAQLKDVPARRQRVQVDKVLKECSLKDVRDKAIGTLSRGYKQRVGIAQAIINDPEVLILDEPTSGLDPVQILQVRNLIKSLEYKRTVVLSTHILPEIEQIARRVVIIKSGQIIADDSLEDLLRSRGSERKVFVRIKGQRGRIEQAVDQTDGLRLISIDSLDEVHSMELENFGGLTDYNDLTDKVLKANGRILEIREIKSDLEAVFLSLNSSGAN